MADISGTSEDLEKFIEAVRKATSNLSDGNDLANEFIDDEKDRNRTLKKEFDNLGLSLKDSTTAVKKDVESLQERAKNEKLVNDALKASGKVRADATKEEIEAYKLTQKQNEAFRSQLDAMGKYLDETGKVIDTNIRLTAAQQRQLTQEKLNSDKKSIQEQGIAQLQSNLSTKFTVANIAVTGLTVGFEILKAGVSGTYNGMLAMQDALLAGAEDETVRAAGAAKLADELASTYGQLGSAAIFSATGLASLALPLLFIAPQFALLSLAAASVIAAFGVFGAGLQKEKELESKRIKEQADQAKDLFAGYQKLSNASLVGADGITGLYRDLHKLGLSVSEFEKFNKVLSVNTKEMAMFAGTTISGVKLFTKQAGDLLNSDLGRTLEIMGIGAEEQFKHQMSYMTLQSQFGLKINGDIKSATYNYINELDKLAILTGQTRKEQEDDRKAVMSMNQLRAAQMMAEEANDTKKSEMLQRAVDAATDLRSVDKELSEGLAKLVAAGGVASDAASSRALQTFGGKGGLLEQIMSGQSSKTDRYVTAIEQAKKQELRFGDTTKITGGVPGLTAGQGELGNILDRSKSIEKAKEEARITGKPLEKFIEESKKVTSQATINAADLRRDNRESKLTMDDLVQAGYSFGDSTKLFGQAVNAFANGKPMPMPSGGAASGTDNGAATMAAKFGGQVGSANGKKAEDLLTFGGGSGSQSNFSGLQPNMQEKVLAAAAEYKALTGQKLQINSANRSTEDQKRLYQETVDAGRPGKGPEGRPVAYPGGSSHEGGRAVDIQNYKDPRAVAAMNKQGLFQNVPGDDVHFSIPKALGGGAFDGPASGYLVEMHAREVAVPLPDPSSKIKIETPNKDPLSSVLADNSVSTSTSTTTNAMMTGIFEMMSSKMDDMIDKLDRGNGYSDKLVKAMA